MNSTTCIICGEVVDVFSTQQHLSESHPTPPDRWRFMFDGVEHRTDRPSMAVYEIMKLLGVSAGYSVYEVRDGEWLSLTDGNSVDLTRSPHLIAVPPATSATR